MEKRESGGQWRQCARSRFCYLTIEGLKPKESYEFRVLAENKHGLSEPSEPTQPCQYYGVQLHHLHVFSGLIPESRVKRPRYEGTDSLGVNNSVRHSASSASFSMMNSHYSSPLKSGYGMGIMASKTMSTLAVQNNHYSRSSRSPSPLRLSTFSSQSR